MARSGKTKGRPRQQKHAARAAPVLSQNLTMQQEARNTERHSLWWSNTSLRHNKINFVSAGDMRLNESDDSTFQEGNWDIRELVSTKESAMNGLEDMPRGTESTSDSPFLIDSRGESTIADTGFADPVPRLHSSATEDSSEDEVVFPGRNNTRNRPFCVNDPPQHAPSAHSTENQSIMSSPTLRDEPDYGPAREPSPASVNSLRQTPPPTTQSINSFPASNRIVEMHPTVEVSDMDIKPPRRKRRSRKAADEAEIMADYIQNMDQDYDCTEGAARLVDEIHDDIISCSGDSSVVDDSSVSEELPLQTGVGKGRTAGRTRWRPEEPLTLSGANDPITTSDENENLDTVYSDSSEISISTSTDDELDKIEEDLDLDEILLNGTSDREDSGGGCSGQSKRKGRSLRKKQSALVSSSADSLEEDPYYGFDIMDFNRPSLKKKTKGRRKALDLELSDSELELELERTWQNDRRKKKIKKQQREELRSQGLLGRKPGKVDMKAKYSNGMSTDDLKMEIRTFLLSPFESLSLPPMSKKDRKLVHDLANAVLLKSQSRGNGSSRFPMLYKTSRTPKYTRKTISNIEKVFSRGRFNRPMGTSWDDKSPNRPAKNRRGRRNAAVSYMDGDVVGASAPEIGAENKGRAMLEKMGWSTGTALGASNNKGILQPVVHVVKNSRAGLG
ncbi:hypothetical protein VTN00DRAFT_7463 [Thermoascus crustaceus]|uniref:uncharacterized protein n=1 Tax=Thermoascus crustaceus TaxID=5088 RepID=UPI003743E148